MYDLCKRRVSLATTCGHRGDLALFEIARTRTEVGEMGSIYVLGTQDAVIRRFLGCSAGKNGEINVDPLCLAQASRIIFCFWVRKHAGVVAVIRNAKNIVLLSGKAAIAHCARLSRRCCSCVVAAGSLTAICI